MRHPAPATCAWQKGGDAIIAPNQALTIKMFKDGDPQGGNALSARDTRRIGRSKSRKIACF